MPITRKKKVDSATLPLSGSERTFGDAHNMEYSKHWLSNNCYGYAADVLMKQHTKLQPGNLSNDQLDDLTCPNVRKLVLQDLAKSRKAYAAPVTKPCKQGFYKIMPFVSRGQEDFHFLVQMKGVKWLSRKGDTLRKLARWFRVPMSKLAMRGKRVSVDAPLPLGTVVSVDRQVWGHKRGTSGPPLVHDCKGRVITHPTKACLSYPDGYNYDQSCGSICITRKPRAKPTRQNRKNKT